MDDPLRWTDTHLSTTDPSMCCKRDTKGSWEHGSRWLLCLRAGASNGDLEGDAQGVT